MWEWTRSPGDRQSLNPMLAGRRTSGNLEKNSRRQIDWAMDKDEYIRTNFRRRQDSESGIDPFAMRFSFQLIEADENQTSVSSFKIYQPFKGNVNNLFSFFLFFFLQITTCTQLCLRNFMSKCWPYIHVFHSLTCTIAKQTHIHVHVSSTNSFIKRLSIFHVFYGYEFFQWTWTCNSFVLYWQSQTSSRLPMFMRKEFVCHISIRYSTARQLRLLDQMSSSLSLRDEKILSANNLAF